MYALLLVSGAIHLFTHILYRIHTQRLIIFKNTMLHNMWICEILSRKVKSRNATCKLSHYRIGPREIIVRGQSYFSRLPKYWPPIPLSARRVCVPLAQPLLRWEHRVHILVGWEHRLAGRWRGWGTKYVHIKSTTVYALVGIGTPPNPTPAG
jgi:hypothetical protein